MFWPWKMEESWLSSEPLETFLRQVDIPDFKYTIEIDSQLIQKYRTDRVKALNQVPTDTEEVLLQ